MTYDKFATLATSQTVPDHVVRADEQPPEARINPSFPALHVLQDFRLHPPATLPDQLKVEQALGLFKVLQLRYLLVENTQGDFAGILAASDILGPQLMVHMRAHQALPDELSVRDVMIPRRKLLSVPYSALQTAKVGDVLHTLEVSGQSFLCVHDGKAPQGGNLRGVFCARDIAERLGDRWTPRLQARSFSELRSTLLGKAELAG